MAIGFFNNGYFKEESDNRKKVKTTFLCINKITILFLNKKCFRKKVEDYSLMLWVLKIIWVKKAKF